MLIEFQIHTDRLTMPELKGRRTFFAVLRLNKRRLWLMRWDTERTQEGRPWRRPFLYSRDRLMCWSAGTQ
jgi:hypothetical protein